MDPQSSRVCASASTDGKCYITSCYVKGVDTDSNGPFGSVTSFGEKLISLSAVGWINCVTFSPSATTLCFASHDGELNFADVTKAALKEKSKPDKVFYKGNPFLSGVFLNESKNILNY